MGRIFRIRTCHGTHLFAETALGRVHHGDLTGRERATLYAFQPDGAAADIFLAAPDGGAHEPELLPQERLGRLIPLRVTATAADGSVAFYSAWTGRFLIAIPHGPEKDSEIVLLDAREPSDFEKFYLEPVDGAEAPAILVAAAPLLERVAEQGVTAASLCHLLVQESPDAGVMRDVLNAAGFQLSRREAERLAERLLAEPQLGRRIAALFPQELSAQHALMPSIAKVREQRGLDPAAARAAARSSEIGPEFDTLDVVGISGKYISFPASTAMLVRRLAKPQKRTAVLATARNEGRYLLEWIAYHKAIGFEGFVIYSNNNDDGSDALLSALAEAGEIVWITNKVATGCRPQWKAYNHALRVGIDTLDYDWLAVIDLDERVELERRLFADINSYLDWCETVPVDSIGLNWLIIGSNGHTHWHEGLLRQRFCLPIDGDEPPKGQNSFIKSLIRSTRFAASMPHHPVEGREVGAFFRDAAMRPFVSSSEGSGQSARPCDRFAWVAHYFFKSNEEFALKFARARGDDLVRLDAPFPALTAEFVRGFVSASLERSNHYVKDEVDRKTEALLAQYMRNPAISAAMAQIKAYYATRLQALLPELAASPAILEAGEAGEAFLRPLLEQQARLTPSHTE